MRRLMLLVVPCMLMVSSLRAEEPDQNTQDPSLRQGTIMTEPVTQPDDSGSSNNQAIPAPTRQTDGIYSAPENGNSETPESAPSED